MCVCVRGIIISIGRALPASLSRIFVLHTPAPTPSHRATRDPVHPVYHPVRSTSTVVSNCGQRNRSDLGHVESFIGTRRSSVLFHVALSILGTLATQVSRTPSTACQIRQDGLRKVHCLPPALLHPPHVHEIQRASQPGHLRALRVREELVRSRRPRARGAHDE